MFSRGRRLATDFCGFEIFSRSGSVNESVCEVTLCGEACEADKLEG